MVLKALWAGCLGLDCPPPLFPLNALCLVPELAQSLSTGSRTWLSWVAVTGSCLDMTYGKHCADAALQRRQPVVGFRPTLQFSGFQRCHICSIYDVFALHCEDIMEGWGRRSCLFTLSQTIEMTMKLTLPAGKHPELKALLFSTNHWCIYRTAAAAHLNTSR